MANLGARLRRLRRQCGYTLQDVSGGSGLTPSFLSRLERGIVNISVGNLRKVAAFFGVPITYFFTEELSPHGIVVRAAARRVGQFPNSEVRWASLLPDEAAAFCAEVLTIPSGGSNELLPHAFSRALFYVLEGEPTCSLGGQVIQLSPGDVLYQRRAVALHWLNEGNAAKVLVVSLQPEEH